MLSLCAVMRAPAALISTESRSCSKESALFCSSEIQAKRLAASEERLVEAGRPAAAGLVGSLVAVAELLGVPIMSVKDFVKVSPSWVGMAVDRPGVVGSAGTKLVMAVELLVEEAASNMLAGSLVVVESGASESAARPVVEEREAAMNVLSPLADIVVLLDVGMLEVVKKLGVRAMRPVLIELASAKLVGLPALE